MSASKKKSPPILPRVHGDRPSKATKRGKKKPCGCVDKLSGLLQNDFRVSSAYNFRTGESVAIISVRRDKKIRDGKKAPTLFATYCPFCGKKYDIATNDISLRE